MTARGETHDTRLLTFHPQKCTVGYTSSCKEGNEQDPISLDWYFTEQLPLHWSLCNYLDRYCCLRENSSPRRWKNSFLDTLPAARPASWFLSETSLRSFCLLCLSSTYSALARHRSRNFKHDNSLDSDIISLKKITESPSEGGKWGTEKVRSLATFSQQSWILSLVGYPRIHWMDHWWHSANGILYLLVCAPCRPSYSKLDKNRPAVARRALMGICSSSAGLLWCGELPYSLCWGAVWWRGCRLLAGVDLGVWN